MNDGVKYKQIPVIEIFGPTIQGEGALAGRVSHFLRTGGCGYKCAWCDSMHAVDPIQIEANAEWLMPNQIVDRIEKLPPADWLTLTGGDPVMWDMLPVVHGAQTLNLKVTVETQGQLWKSWLLRCDQVTVSPKPPSSGMTGKMKMDILEKYANNLAGKLSMKIVVFDDTDFDFAVYMRKSFPQVNFFLSAGTPQYQKTKASYPEGSEYFADSIDTAIETKVRDEILARYSWLAERALKTSELRAASVLPQLHVLLWGTKLGV